MEKQPDRLTFSMKHDWNNISDPTLYYTCSIRLDWRFGESLYKNIESMLNNMSDEDEIYTLNKFILSQLNVGVEYEVGDDIKYPAPIVSLYSRQHMYDDEDGMNGKKVPIPILDHDAFEDDANGFNNADGQSSFEQIIPFKQVIVDGSNKVAALYSADNVSRHRPKGENSGTDSYNRNFWWSDEDKHNDLKGKRTYYYIYVQASQALQRITIHGAGVVFVENYSIEKVATY